MSGWQWRDEYEALLREGEARGELNIRAGPDERRRQPRFRLKSQHVWIKVEPRFRVVDVSVTGISVYSDFPFRVGQGLNITLGKAFTLEATVVECTLVLADENLLENQYLVRCEFANESVGMQVLVMLKEMDDLELARPPGSGSGIR